MKKKTILIICIIFIVILVLIYAVYASFNGSVLHKISVKENVKEYIVEKYPEQEWKISPAKYEFKYGDYYCHVQSSTSADTFFNVYETTDKKLEDDYELRVTNKDNTIWRISDELDDAVDQKVMPIYPHRSRLMIGRLYDEEGYDISDFELDMKVDLMALPHPASFTFWVETSHEEPTWEEAAELLREAVRLTKEAGIDFSYYSISLEYPYEEIDGELIPTNFDSIIGANDVPEEVILSDGLEEYLAGKR